ncbi:hypothetical protein KKH15_01945 [Patescibacteria group bacterium]|nr:hypothetical protein [Patescibacteria group bacterium]MBU1755114.1 hypothetical protein [Patescibacteria group bacterium]
MQTEAKNSGFRFVVGFNHNGAKGGAVKSLGGLVPYNLFCEAARNQFGKIEETDLPPGALHVHMTCEERTVADTLLILSECSPISFAAVELALQQEGESVAQMMACFKYDGEACIVLFQKDRAGKYSTRVLLPDELVPIRIACLTMCRRI